MQISPPVCLSVILFFQNSRCHQIRSKSSETEAKDMENDIYNYLQKIPGSTWSLVAELQR